MPRYEFLLDTYDTERLKTLSVWSQFRDEDLSFRPEPLARTPLEQMVHQCVSEDVWMKGMLGIDLGEPPLPSGRISSALSDSVQPPEPSPEGFRMPLRGTARGMKTGGSTSRAVWTVPSGTSVGSPRFQPGGGSGGSALRPAMPSRQGPASPPQVETVGLPAGVPQGTAKRSHFQNRREDGRGSG